MAISTYKVFLMHKGSSEASYTKLIDIKEFPDLRGKPSRVRGIHPFRGHVVVLLHNADVGKTGGSCHILACGSHFWIGFRQRLRDWPVNLIFDVDHTNTSFASVYTLDSSSFTVSYMGMLAGLPWVMTTVVPLVFSFTRPFVPGSP